MNEVVFHRIDGKNPHIELAALKELKKEKHPRIRQRKMRNTTGSSSMTMNPRHLS